VQRYEKTLNKASTSWKIFPGLTLFSTYGEKCQVFVLQFLIFFVSLHPKKNESNIHLARYWLNE